MSKETFTKIVDDLDGGPADETVTVGLNGRWVELDLSTQNAAHLYGLLAPYLDKGRPFALRQATASARAVVAKPDKGVSLHGLARAWAVANGVDVPGKGRVPTSVLERYRIAMEE